MQGYVARMGASETINFTGSLNTGDIGSADNVTIAVSGTDKIGFNLVSNPYPSAIDFASTASGLTRTNLVPTIWYRSGGTFPTFNWTTDVGANLGQRYIPAMQAFWIQVASGNTTGTLEFSNPTRIHESQSFYKTQSTTNVFRIELSRDSLIDEAVVSFFQGAQDDLDSYDSEKMFSPQNNYPQIYTLTSNASKVIINGFPELNGNEERIIPLGFLSNISGDFTLQATNINDFNYDYSVYLEDIQLNVIQNLRQTNTYTFNSGVVNDTNRFRLHFGNITTNLSSSENTPAIIYAIKDAIYVNNSSENNGYMELFDMNGRKLFNQKAIKGLNKIQINVSEGIYLVYFKNDNQVVTQKIMIHK